MSVAGELPEPGWPPPDTVAVLVTAELGVNVETTVIVGKLAPGANASAPVPERVHTPVPRVHDQPVPDSAVMVPPVPSPSVTVTVPAVGSVPWFVTVTLKVYVLPLWAVTAL